MGLGMKRAADDDRNNTIGKRRSLVESVLVNCSYADWKSNSQRRGQH
jgi:hypothetical protein